MLPDTFMVEMIARPEPKRFESEDSTRVATAFNKVVHGFKQVYGTVHYGNHDASDYGSPIAKVHWILQASSIGHLQKMKKVFMTTRLTDVRNACTGFAEDEKSPASPRALGCEYAGGVR